MGCLANEWALKSLTIGPQSNETNLAFLEEAFRGLPPLPSVDNVTVVYNYSRAWRFNTDCWRYFDGILSRRDLFPALEGVHIHSTFGWQKLTSRRWWAISWALRAVRARGIEPRKLLAFG